MIPLSFLSLSPSGTWNARDEWKFRTFGYTGLFLTELDDFAGFNDLGFLPRLENLRNLTVLKVRGKVDLVPVGKCPGLRKINIQAKPKEPVDFSGLQNLVEARIDHSEGLSSILKLGNLERLTLFDFDGTDLKDFAELASVRILQLYGAKTLKSLDGLEKLANLQELNIEDAPELADISAFSELGRQVVLRIDGDKIYRERDLDDEQRAMVVERWGQHRLDTFYKPRPRSGAKEYEVGLGGIKEVEVPNEE
jgi:hypothetical protein